MRAAIYSSYGPPEVVQIREVEKPRLAQNDILIRVHATTLCPADWRYRKADPALSRLFSGLFRPTKIPILGMEFAGTVEAAGESVTRYRVGDEVFGSKGFQKMGAHAEYLSVNENSTVALKPANMTFEEAAGVLYGGLAALHFLKKAEIKEGQEVLIYGASGSVGIFAVQLAKHFGAHVTGVSSAKNLDLVKSLGADEVIDYTKDDFSKGGRIYDVVLDSVGKSGYARTLRSLKRGGVYERVGGSGRLSSMVGSILAGTWISMSGAARFVGGVTQGGREAQAFLKDLIEAGKIRTVIDRCYPLDEIVEAHRYVEGGHKVGNVIIVVCGSALPVVAAR